MATPSAQQQQQQHQDYFRSVSSESTTYMMVPAGGASGSRRQEAPSKMWVAMVVLVVVVLQIASTTGLFLYLNMSISQVRARVRLLSAQTGRQVAPAHSHTLWIQSHLVGNHGRTFRKRHQETVESVHTVRLKRVRWTLVATNTKQSV